MSKSTTQKRINIEEQIKALEKQRKQLLQKERAEAEKARKQRQANRGGLIEKLLPHLATLTEQEFEAYMKKLLTPEAQPPKSQGGISVQQNVKEVIADE